MQSALQKAYGLGYQDFYYDRNNNPFPKGSELAAQWEAGYQFGVRDNGGTQLRAITVEYSDGTVITTDMAAHLTDNEMLTYFAVGRWFNIGNVHDNMQQVVSATIIK